MAEVPAEHKDPRIEAIAAAIVEYRTDGMCQIDKACGMCDCEWNPGMDERTRDEAAFILQRLAPVLALLAAEDLCPDCGHAAAVHRGDIGCWNGYFYDQRCGCSRAPQDIPRKPTAQDKLEAIRAIATVLTPTGDRTVLQQRKVSWTNEVIDAAPKFIADEDEAIAHALTTILSWGEDR